MARVTPARKPTCTKTRQSGNRLQTIPRPRPEYQYKAGDILFPAAKADEPKPERGGRWRRRPIHGTTAPVVTRQRQCALPYNGSLHDDAPEPLPTRRAAGGGGRDLFAERPKMKYMVRPETTRFSISRSLGSVNGRFRHQATVARERQGQGLCEASCDRRHVEKKPWPPGGSLYLQFLSQCACSPTSIGTLPGWLRQVRPTATKPPGPPSNG